MKGPIIDFRGTKRWYNDEWRSHREDGPAVEWYDGDKFWYYNGRLIGRSDKGFTQEDFERFLKIKEYW